jgi:hypothetical protein
MNYSCSFAVQILRDGNGTWRFSYFFPSVAAAFWGFSPTTRQVGYFSFPTLPISLALPTAAAL